MSSWGQVKKVAEADPCAKAFVRALDGIYEDYVLDEERLDCDARADLEHDIVVYRRELARALGLKE